jgi:hypothetical protein
VRTSETDFVERSPSGGERFQRLHGTLGDGGGGGGTSFLN